MNPSGAELALLRTRPHNTKLYLSIFQPQPVFKARVNDASIAQGELNITFDTVTLGAYTDVKYDYMMYVGTTDGGNEKGRVRCRSAYPTYIEVAENYFIDWADDDYITVVNFIEIDARYPRIIQDPGDDTRTIWYKDYDITYAGMSDPNVKYGAFIQMGSHFAGFLENGSCLIYYDASDSEHVVDGASISNCWWEFEGGIPGTYQGLTPGYINYTGTGHFTTRLYVSGSNSSFDASNRQISIYDKPNEGDSPPVVKWELIKLEGNREAGGYSATIRIRQDVSNNYVRDGSLVVIFAEDWYGSTKQSIGGNATTRDSIVFTGYVVDGTIHYNYHDKYIEFEVVSPTGVMKLAESFACSLEDVDDPEARSEAQREYYPSPWALLQGMNVKKALYHYLRWHSTAQLCMDIQFIGTDQNIQYADFDRESLYSAIDTFIRGALRGRAVSDMQGKLYLETDLYTRTVGSSNSFKLDNMDWVGEPTIDEQLTPPVSYIEAGGIAYSGFNGAGTGTSTAYMSGAPGLAPGYRGTIQRIQGLALADQDGLNTLSGRIFSYENRKYPRVEFDLSGNFRNFDIAPQERYDIHILASQNPRGVDINEDFFVESMNWTYDPQLEIFKPIAGFSHLPSSIVGSSISIPPIPDFEDDDYNVPPIEVPPIEIPPIVIPGIGQTNILPVMFASGDATFGSDGWTISTLLTVTVGTAYWFGSGGVIKFTPIILNHNGGNITVSHVGSLYNRLINWNNNDVLNYAVATSYSTVTSIDFYSSATMAAKQLSHIVTGALGQYLVLTLSMTARDSALDELTIVGWAVNYDG